MFTAIAVAFSEKSSLVALEITSSMLPFECVCKPAKRATLTTANHLA